MKKCVGETAAYRCWSKAATANKAKSGARKIKNIYRNVEDYLKSLLWNREVRGSKTERKKRENREMKTQNGW